MTVDVFTVSVSADRIVGVKVSPRYIAYLQSPAVSVSADRIVGVKAQEAYAAKDHSIVSVSADRIVGVKDLSDTY